MQGRENQTFNFVLISEGVKLYGLKIQIYPFTYRNAADCVKGI